MNRALTRLTAFLFLSAILFGCCKGGSCRSNPNEVLSKMAGTRRLVIGMRSFAGSRTEFLNAAAQMLMASGGLRLGGGASDYDCFDDERGREFLIGSVLYETDLSVEGVLGVMKAVEERLRDPHGSAQAPALELLLFWVEGVEVSTPEVTLPSPLLEKHRWAVGSFTEAGEDAILHAVKRGTEDRAVAKRIARAFRRLEYEEGRPPPKWGFSGDGLGRPMIERKAGRVTLQMGAVDGADVFGVAAHLLMVSQVDWERRVDSASESGERAGGEADRVLEKMGADTTAAVEVEFPKGASLPDRVLIWTQHLAAKLESAEFRAFRAVVWTQDAHSIRGALIGQKTLPRWPHRVPVDVACERLEGDNPPAIEITLATVDVSP